MVAQEYRTFLNVIVNTSDAIFFASKFQQKPNYKRALSVKPYVTELIIAARLRRDEMPCSIPNRLLRARISSECGPSSCHCLPSRLAMA